MGNSLAALGRLGAALGQLLGGSSWVAPGQLWAALGQLLCGSWVSRTHKQPVWQTAGLARPYF